MTTVLVDNTESGARRKKRPRSRRIPGTRFVGLWVRTEPGRYLMTVDVDDTTIYGSSRLLKDHKYLWVVWCVSPKSMRLVRHGIRNGQRDAQSEAETVAIEVRRSMIKKEAESPEELP